MFWLVGGKLYPQLGGEARKIVKPFESTLQDMGPLKQTLSLHSF